MPEVVYLNLKPWQSAHLEPPVISLRNKIKTRSKTQAPSPATKASGNLPGLHYSLHNGSEQMQISRPPARLASLKADARTRA
jgi:hypothetical protein